MLLLHDSALAARREVVAGPLAPLFDSLARELEPLFDRDLYVPSDKALLSRAGGRCAKDGTTLQFDPWKPREHRCPQCGTAYDDDAHHRAWITSYQLWLAERALHAAVLHALEPNERHGRLARDILTAYAERYVDYPNVDNVLGPTRLFFSTYLESIWLLQIALAASALAATGDHQTAQLACDRIIHPSSQLIAEFDEGLSNRQVWNNAALLAAAVVTNRAESFDALLGGSSGVLSHLRHGLLSDGTWYEGENYHLFALRGLWYAVAMSEARGITLPDELRSRFERAFVTPFITALPDFTMPSRKDSQYAISLRQWRVAELAEIGFARTRDPELGMALRRCYEPGHPQRETGRATSTADVERNSASSALTRADLGWRGLLFALPALPSLAIGAPRSTLLEGQGIAVFRRDGDVYAALDFGQSGGGHGHPDRLNLLLSQGSVRWLDDMGTGSYVDPSLHWYRSTLAHNAPLIEGKSQPLGDGELRAYDEREGLGWAEATFDIEDVRIERTIVVAPDYLIQELRWAAPRRVLLELPWHLNASARDLAFDSAMLRGGDAPEDGFAFVHGAQSAGISRGTVVRLEATGERTMRVSMTSDVDVALFLARGPGQPASTTRSFYVMRGEAQRGCLRAVLSWSTEAVRPSFEKDTTLVDYSDGERHVHRRGPDGWHVDLFAGHARSSVELTGLRASPARKPASVKDSSRAPAVLRRSRQPAQWPGETPQQRDDQLLFTLGENHYRRSEHGWRDAGEPAAIVAVTASDTHLVISIDVRAGDRRFQPADAVNPFDNEHPDTMGAGVQLYIRTPDCTGAWILVPEHGSDRVRARTLAASDSASAPVARWRERDHGYVLRVEWPLPLAGARVEYPLDLDVVVNETVDSRQRRRGQLVMSGARGEFVYLRGDRHDAERLIPIVLAP